MPYGNLLWFWSDQRDLKLQIAGLSTGHDQAVVVRSPASLGFCVTLFRDGRLLAVEAVNRAGDFMAARKLLTRASGLERSTGKAFGFDLRAWEAVTR